MDLTVIAALVLAIASSLTAGATLLNSLVNRNMIKLQREMKDLQERDLKMREDQARVSEIMRVANQVISDRLMDKEQGDKSG